jgi:hypothetical protein
MDPDSITATVLTALAAAGAAGAANGVQEATSDAVQRAYDRLRDSLRALWGRRSATKDSNICVADAEKLVEKFQEEPDIWADNLRQLLIAAGADNDIELNRRSLGLLNALESQNRRHVFFINSQGLQYNEQKTKKPRQVNVFPPRYS